MNRLAPFSVDEAADKVREACDNASGSQMSSSFWSLNPAWEAEAIACKVVSVEGVCGGEPIIAGTRIPVRHIWGLAKQIGWSVERICKEFPQLTPSQVYAALAYVEMRPHLQIAENGDEAE